VFGPKGGIALQLMIDMQGNNRLRRFKPLQQKQ
jgi:hypothetical protein